jgi:hypothetical protein
MLAPHSKRCSTPSVKVKGPASQEEDVRIMIWSFYSCIESTIHKSHSSLSQESYYTSAGGISVQSTFPSVYVGVCFTFSLRPHPLHCHRPINISRLSLAKNHSRCSPESPMHRSRNQIDLARSTRTCYSTAFYPHSSAALE